MAYYVLTDDGQRFGPADIPTLQQWIHEGRVNANSTLQDETTGDRVAARNVPGLSFGQQVMGGPAPGPGAPGGGMGSPYGTPPGQAPYYRPPGSVGGYDDGQKDVTNAYILGVVSLLCCGILSIFGLMKANEAKRKGHPGAQGAIILNIVAICLWVIGVFINFVVIGASGFN